MHIPSETYDVESYRDEESEKKEAPMEYLLTVGDIRVRLSHIGEGIYGDYDSRDETDIPLLRFDIEKFRYYNDNTYGEWEAIDDASYCTRIEADRHWTDVMAYLNVIMNEIYQAAHEGFSIKKACERLSWIG